MSSPRAATSPERHVTRHRRQPPAVSHGVSHGGSPLKRAQQHKARLLSCASRASSTWLTALPIHTALTLSNSALRNAFQLRLGLHPWPLAAPRVRCGCGALVDPPPGRSDPDFFQHAQKCPQLAAARSARHHILCGAWCQVMQSTGLPTSLESNCSKVSGAHLITTAGAQADILTVLQDRLLLSDASVSHYCADTYVERAAVTAGSAAEVRAQKKVHKYALYGPGGYDFTPLVVECYVCRCTAIHALLNKLGHLTADSGRVTKGAWIEGALRRFSVALCKENDFAFRANLYSFCRATGKHPTRGAAVPHTLEV